MRLLHRKHALLGWIGLALWVGTTWCRADTTVTFNESSTYQDGSQLSGTVEFDETYGFIESVALTGNFEGTPVTIAGGNSAMSDPFFYPSPYFYEAIVFGSLPLNGGPIATTLLLGIALPGSGYGIPGYAGGPQCSLTYPCYGYGYLDEFVPPGYYIQNSAVSGTLTLPAAVETPEPGSIWLLGSGMAMTGWVVRRRIA